MSPRLHLLVLAALATACTARESRPPAAENPKYAFPHGTHVDAGLSCTTCHGDVAQATSVAAAPHVRLPSGDAAKACTPCHEQVPAAPPPRRVERTITFSHAQHLPYVKGDCARCHTALVEAGADRAPVPPMSACTSCHAHAQDYAEARCQPCHVDLKRYPLKPVADFKHAGDFLRTHAQMARSSAASCAACHEQTSCAECHAATTRPFKPDVQWPERVGASFIHRGDYVSRHTLDFRADPASCRRCHGSASCDACHAEVGVSQRTATSGGRTPHPPGWAAGLVHGAAARQDILSCAACHDQGARSTCVSCHRTVDPHPSGWAQRHNKTTDVVANSMCRTCHTQ
jgi:cytochrome c7-like protein